MAATSDKLGQLHAIFTEYLLSLLEPSTNEEGEEIPASLSAPQMAVIAKFLKDNNIAAVDDDDDEVAQLKEALRSRAKARGFSAEDADLAMEGATYGMTH